MSIAAVREKNRPMVTIVYADFDRLEALAWAGRSDDNPVADFLAAELDRAVICPEHAIGANIVRMNSRVAFRIGNRSNIQIRTLVYPQEYSRQGSREDHLSVMTPLGAALIGLQGGSCMRYETGNGATQYVTVEAVLHQPDAAEGKPAGGGEECSGTATLAREGYNCRNDDDPGPAAA